MSNCPGAESSCPLMSRNGRPAPENLIMLVFLVFETLLFSLFTLIMFIIQIKSIWCDSTNIENRKKEKRKRLTGCVSFKNVFGDNPLLWLSPFTCPPSKENHDSMPHEPLATNFTCPVWKVQHTLHKSINLSHFLYNICTQSRDIFRIFEFNARDKWRSS